MMRQTETFGYGEGEAYQVVEMPYDGGELSMVILLPEAGQFEVFEGSLKTQKVGAILKDLEFRSVTLTMPKFEFESEFRLKKALSDMGMPDAFVWEIADFSGMTGNRDLLIADVVHKAFVSVDAGTEAAAATAVIMPIAMPLGELVEVTVDRPFIFLIRDIETGTILFVGRIVNPSA